MTEGRPTIRQLMRRASAVGLHDSPDYTTLKILREIAARYNDAASRLYGDTLVREGKSVREARELAWRVAPWHTDMDWSEGLDGYDESE